LDSKPSNLKLNSYLPALTKLNVVYLLKDESYPLKVHYNIQMRLFLNESFNICAIVPKHFQKLVLACPAILHFHAGLLDELAMLLHHLGNQIIGVGVRVRSILLRCTMTLMMRHVRMDPLMLLWSSLMMIVTLA
jgi:hypothetical protein